VEANSRLETTRSLARLMGAGVAGLLIQALSAPVTVLLDAVSFATSTALIGLIRRPLTSLAAGGVLAGPGHSVYNINQVSLRQAITPLYLQGRVNGTMRFLVWGTMPLGGLVGGVLGEMLGLRFALTVLAALEVLPFLWVALSPVRELRAIPATEG